MKQKVFIGVGHGGSDPGASGNGFEESDLNLSIALACQAELVRHGVVVQMSRTKDENDDLTEEIEECNKFNPDLAADIHNNAGGGDGAEVFHSINGGTGKTLAVNILGEIQKVGQNSRGAKTRKNSKGADYYGFIRLTKCPAVIVECAFVDHKKDIQIIDTPAEQKAMGIAIAKGILKTLGIAYKEEGTQEETTDGKFNTSKWGVYKVNTQAGLWLRSGASTKDKAIELMKDGAKVICYGFYNGDWYMVASETGKVGFCHSDYLIKEVKNNF
jgi:N-acetylmuramoyl-L-alanine amidase